MVINASYYFYFCINQFIKIRFSWSDRPLQAANSVLFIQSTHWLSLIILLATLLMPNLIEDCLYNLEWFFFSLTLNTQIRSFISWSVKTKKTAKLSWCEKEYVNALPFLVDRRLKVDLRDLMNFWCRFSVCFSFSLKKLEPFTGFAKESEISVKFLHSPCQLHCL